MIVLAGPGVKNLQYYSSKIDADSIQIQENQGDTLNTFSCTLYDPSSAATIVCEDDVVVCDEMDPNGFPCVNLAPNPSLEGTYTSGIAPSWSTTGTLTGFTFSKATSGMLFGAAAQQMVLSNAPNGNTVLLYPQITLPVDENQSPLLALPYYWSIWYNTTVGFVGCTLTLVIDFLNSGGGVISSSVAGNLLLNTSGVWSRASTNGIAPAGAVSVKVRVICHITSATNSGTLLLDGAQFEYATCANAMVNATQTALQAGKYPTPYCDNTRPGCYTDTGKTGLYYRQLRLFGGFPKTVQETYGAGPSRLLVLNCVEYGILLQEALVNLIVSSITDVAAIAAAATYAKNNGCLVGLDTSTYVTSLASISGMSFSWTTFRDVLNAICNQTQAAFYVDPYCFLHYQQNLALSAPFTVAQTPNMVTSFPFSAFVRTLDNTEGLTYHVVEGGTQMSGVQTYSSTGTGSQVLWTVNGGNPIDQVDSVTVGGTAQKVGVQGNDVNGVNGVQVLYDPNGGTVTFNAAPGNTVAVVVLFRFLAPIVVVVQNPKAEAPTGSTRRRIQAHEKFDVITSVQSGVDRAKNELSMASKAQPVATLTITTPPCPIATPIRAGMALQITYNPATLSSVQFQVQQVTTTAKGNGVIQRDVQLGYYRPDLIALTSQQVRENAQIGTDQSAGATLTDAALVTDGWALTDSNPMPTVSNIGGWAPPTVGTWSGTNRWG